MYCWIMSAKTIAVDQEAYELLSKAKRQGETFSDVVKRAMAPRSPISNFAGAWKSMSEREWAEVRDSIAKGRRLDASRRKRLEVLWDR